jgi:molybdopterin molybdotransferase
LGEGEEFDAHVSAKNYACLAQIKASSIDLGVISIDEARDIVRARVQLLTIANVPLPAARDHVLREDAKSPGYFPNADVSMMDGYAIRTNDLSERFRIVGEVRAGAVPEQGIGEGECVRIFTGAPLPDGADAVIPQEDTEVQNDFMIPTQRSAKRWVRLRGSEGQPGQVIAAAPLRLGGVELAALAQAGCTHPATSAVLAVAHIATGDEIVDAMTEPEPGKIRDTNSLLLCGLVGDLGATFSSNRCGDVLEDLIAAIPQSEKLVLISGGANVGAYDFGSRALRDSGFAIHFDKVNLRPGKPLTFATRGDQVAFVIPGNPVSHFVCFQTVIRLAIERLLGIMPRWSFVEMAHEGDRALPSDARETFWPARVVVRDGRLVAIPKHWSSSGDTFSLVGTNALIRLPREGDPIPPGAIVRVLLLDVPGASE